MPTARPVLETHDLLEFDRWPIAPLTEDRLITLSGGISAIEVGTAMAVLLEYNGLLDGYPLEDLTTDRFTAIMDEQGVLIAPGGLLFADSATGVRVAPGCCFGLESWRTWLDAPEEDGFWPGHNLPYRLVRRPDALHLVHEPASGPSGSDLVIPLSELPHLVDEAGRALAGFLALARVWLAARASPGMTDLLIRTLAVDLRIPAEERPSHP